MKILKGCFTPKSLMVIMPMINASLWNPLPSIGISPSHRSEHAACVYDDCLYVHGGRSHRGIEQDLWKYDFLSKCWIKIDLVGDKPPPLKGHTMIVFEKKLYVFGGELSFASAGEIPLWVFDPSNQTWKKLSNPDNGVYPSGRLDHITFIYNNCMYVHGGYADLKGSLNEFWKYNFMNNQWNHIDEALIEPCPQPRYKHVGIVKENLLWICGGLMGVTNKNLNQTWTWNFIAKIWCVIKSKHKPSQLFGHAAVCVNEEIFIFGGKREDGFSCSKLWKVSNAFSQNNIWTICGTTGHVHPSPMSGHCLIALSNDYFNPPSNILENRHLILENSSEITSHKNESSSYENCNESYVCEEPSPTYPKTVLVSQEAGDFDYKEKLQSKVESSLFANDFLNAKHQEIIANKNVIQFENGDNSDWSVSDQKLYRIQTVNHYSYNLSPFQQTWNLSNQQKPTNLETTSFIDLPEDIESKVMISSSENSNHEESLAKLPNKSISALYENAEKLQSISKIFSNSQSIESLDGNREDDSSKRPTRLLLIGGNINQSTFHYNEALNMWDCNLFFY